jgi:Rrf2 family protein
MKLTSQEEYGFRCLLQIGRAGPGGSLTIPEISEAEGISVPYTAKLLRMLRRGGFVKSVRGKEGGYSLARPADQIVVGKVLETLGGRFFEPGFCESHAGQATVCTHSVDCSIRSLWRTVQVALDQVLAKTTLQDLLRTEVEMTGWVASVSPPKGTGSVRPPAV